MSSDVRLLILSMFSERFSIVSHIPQRISSCYEKRNSILDRLLAHSSIRASSMPVLGSIIRQPSSGMVSRRKWCFASFQSVDGPIAASGNDSGIGHDHILALERNVCDDCGNCILLFLDWFDGVSLYRFSELAPNSICVGFPGIAKEGSSCWR